MGVGILFGEGEELMGDTILLEVAVEAERQGALAGARIIVLDKDELLHNDFLKLHRYYVNYGKYCKDKYFTFPKFQGFEFAEKLLATCKIKACSVISTLSNTGQKSGVNPESSR
jgi:hypothetical protein